MVGSYEAAVVEEREPSGSGSGSSAAPLPAFLLLLLLLLDAIVCQSNARFPSLLSSLALRLF